jgi:hypothetical protein
MILRRYHPSRLAGDVARRRWPSASRDVKSVGGTGAARDKDRLALPALHELQRQQRLADGPEPPTH